MENNVIIKLDVIYGWPKIPDEMIYWELLIGLKDYNGNLYTKGGDIMSIESEIKEQTIDEIVGDYVSIRDDLKLLQKGWKDIEEMMKGKLDVLSMELRERADALGVESFKTKHGTAFKQLKETYRVSDWLAFIEFVKETDNFQLLERRVAKNAAREIHKTDGHVPPGLDYFAEFEFMIRRPTKETKDNGD